MTALPLSQPIATAPLFTKLLRTTLVQHDIKTLGELVERTEIELLRLKWFSGTHLRTVRADLARHGLKLRPASESVAISEWPGGA